MIVILMARCLVLSVNHLVVSVCVYQVCEDVGVMNAALEPLTSLPLDAQVRKNQYIGGYNSDAYMKSI